jgi:hypothetical protein
MTTIFIGKEKRVLKLKSIIKSCDAGKLFVLRYDQTHLNINKLVYLIE